MPRFTALFAIALLTTTGQTPASEPSTPIKALLVTGGCCHDYEAQKKILTTGISARANVEWTIVHEGGNAQDHRVSIHEHEDWAAPYDVVVHNECFAQVKDVDLIHRITKAHKQGKPAVVIHCAMHSYRGETDEWFKLVGVTSHNHGRHHPIKVEVIERAHPIMQGVPGSWTTPQGELYNIAKVWPETTPLANGVSDKPGNPNPCIWINQYGRARVFGTSIGHHNETMEDPAYLDLITRGLLWTVDQLADNGQPQPGYEGNPLPAAETPTAEPSPTLAE